MITITLIRLEVNRNNLFCDSSFHFNKLKNPEKCISICVYFRFVNFTLKSTQWQHCIVIVLLFGERYTDKFD